MGQLSFTGGAPGDAGVHAFSRWEARTRTFRQGGLPHRVLVLSDLRRALRQEERQAWQRLIRVLSHEINNSLTPIQSIAQSLQVLLTRGGVEGEGRQDLADGLQVIGSRAEAVGQTQSGLSVKYACSGSIDGIRSRRQPAKSGTSMSACAEAGGLFSCPASPRCSSGSGRRIQPPGPPRP